MSSERIARIGNHRAISPVSYLSSNVFSVVGDSMEGESKDTGVCTRRRSPLSGRHRNQHSLSHLTQDFAITRVASGSLKTQSAFASIPWPLPRVLRGTRGSFTERTWTVWAESWVWCRRHYSREKQSSRQETWALSWSVWVPKHTPPWQSLLPWRGFRKSG